MPDGSTPPPEPPPEPPTDVSERRIVIRGAKPAAEGEPRTSRTSSSRAGSGTRSKELKTAVVVAGAGGALFALAPLLAWWNLEAIPGPGPGPADQATFASIKGVQQWPGFLSVIVGAAVLILVVVASKPDVDAALRKTLGRAITGAAIAGLALGLLAIATGSDMIHVTGFTVSSASAVHLAWLGAIVAGVGGVLVSRSASG